MLAVIALRKPKPMSDDGKRLPPRDTVTIVVNALAAILLVVGGTIGFVKSGSLSSIATSVLFAAPWLWAAYALRSNSSPSAAAVQNPVAAGRACVVAHTVAAVTGFALSLLMLVRMTVGGAAPAPQLFAVVVIGAAVCFVNARRIP